ncbi:MAG: hypothetical protein GY793_05775 [Proteobacteria bacterium]|nr:hypothetical protein [Pseudomonadota bacterium]
MKLEKKPGELPKLVHLNENVGKTDSVGGGFIKKINGTIYVGTRYKGIKKLNTKTQQLESVSSTLDEKGNSIDMANSIAEADGDIFTWVRDSQNIKIGTLQLLDFSKVVKHDKAIIEKSLVDLKITKQGKTPLSEVAKQIQDIEKFKEYTGIDLKGVELSSITLSAITVDQTNGKINFDLNIHTGGRINVLKGSISGKTDKKVSNEIANSNQKDDLEMLKKEMEKINHIVDQGFLKVSEIKEKIKDCKSLER